MKRILLSVFAIVLSFGAFAKQTPAQKATISTPQEARGQKVFLKNDRKTYIVNEGVKTELTTNVILSNETVVTAIGQVKNSSGSTVTLEDGQYVNQKGEVSELK